MIMRTVFVPLANDNHKEVELTIPDGYEAHIVTDKDGISSVKFIKTPNFFDDATDHAWRDKVRFIQNNLDSPDMKIKLIKALREMFPALTLGEAKGAIDAMMSNR